MPSVLRTPRLKLALVEPALARRLADGPGPDEDWATGYPTEGALLGAELISAAAAGGRPFGAFGTYQVIRRTDGRVIGDAGFQGPPDALGAVHVGVMIAPEERGRGYGTEALGALLGWARGQDGLTCVLADCSRTNVAARRMLERAGMDAVGAAGELQYFMA